MSEQNVTGLRGGVNIYDDKLVNKTGLGCGCDITGEIGNCKTQILDFEKLKNYPYGRKLCRDDKKCQWCIGEWLCIGFCKDGLQLEFKFFLEIKNKES